jgi:hypothetical protein
MFYFVTLTFAEWVHAQGLGFTKTYYAYVWASSPEHSSHLATAWYQMKDCIVDRADSLPALQQDLARFCFPESIINLPDDVLQREYDRRGWPDSFREPGRRVPASMMQ